MKIALATTTIYEPTVLHRYRQLDPDVHFVIAGDIKTPDDAVRSLADEIGNCTFLSTTQQHLLYPELSLAIGWNSIQRRNIAVLEAAKLKPDVIISIDDDNEPRDDQYFEHIREAFSTNHDGHVASFGWFNVGHHAEDLYRYRGLPLDAYPNTALGWDNGSRPVGVLNGLIYGDPDIDAVTRIADNPHVTWYDEWALRGIATIPSRTWAPVNSQNTAWRAELAPLAMVLPHVGRYDDIWGSYIAQRVMEATDYCVKFGPPAVVQDRHDHDVLHDLEQELFGMRHTPAFVEALKAIEVNTAEAVLEMGTAAAILTNLRHVLCCLAETTDLALPWPFFTAWVAAWEAVRETSGVGWPE